MSITREKTAELTATFGATPQDTGAPRVQVALLKVTPGLGDALGVPLVGLDLLEAALGAAVVGADHQDAAIGRPGLVEPSGAPRMVGLVDQRRDRALALALQVQPVGQVGRVCRHRLLELADALFVLPGLDRGEALLVKAIGRAARNGGDGSGEDRDEIATEAHVRSSPEAQRLLLLEWQIREQQLVVVCGIDAIRRAAELFTGRDKGGVSIEPEWNAGSLGGEE